MIHPQPRPDFDPTGEAASPVASELRDVADLAQHLDLLASIVAGAPHLQHRAQRVQRMWRRIQGEIDDLYAAPALRAIQQIARAVRDAEREERALVFEAYWRDVGGSD